MAKLRRSDISDEDLNRVCEIVNRGNTAEFKKERDNLVIVEVRRKAHVKKPVSGY